MAAQAAKRAATVHEVAAKTPIELHALDFLYPDRFVRDPAFAREVHRLRQAGHYPSFIPRLPDSYLPLDDKGQIDERKLARLRASFAFLNDPSGSIAG